ncbi:hypothetical protein EG835_06535 [bacterium]|nr:hypothetical protein [bacterium]
MSALAFVLTVSLTMLCASSALAQTPSPNSPTSGELVEQPKKFDGTWVNFTGEAIGEVMVRGDRAWIHLNDDAYYLENVEEGAHLGGYNSGHAVWLPADLARSISHYGDYKHEGDVVRVRGVFNAACPEHGGDMDIHATTLDVVKAGREVVDPVLPWKIWWAALLSITAAAFFGLLRMRAMRGATSRS